MEAKIQFGDAAKVAVLVEPQGGFKDRIKERLKQIANHSKKYYPLFFRVYAGNLGKAAAIKAKCLDCACWQRNEITHCTVITCPLWAHRPYQNDSESDDEPST